VAPNFYLSATYAGSGHIVAGTAKGDLEAVKYDPKGAASSPISVLQSVYWSWFDGEVKFGISLNGTMVYAPADITQRSLVYVDEIGQIAPATAEHQPYLFFDLSPDGRKVAEAYVDSGQFNAGVWIVDLERGGRTLLPPASRTGAMQMPVWSPDGSRIF